MRASTERPSKINMPPWRVTGRAKTAPGQLARAVQVGKRPPASQYLAGGIRIGIPTFCRYTPASAPIRKCQNNFQGIVPMVTLIFLVVATMSGFLVFMEARTEEVRNAALLMALVFLLLTFVVAIGDFQDEIRGLTKPKIN